MSQGSSQSVSPSDPTQAQKSPPQEAPIKRLTCDLCRQRKVKCDRAYPECGRCRGLGHRCSYRGRSNNKFNQVALLSELQERMKQAEARLAIQNSGTSLGKRTRCSTDSPLNTDTELDLPILSTSLSEESTEVAFGSSFDLGDGHGGPSLFADIDYHSWSFPMDTNPQSIIPTTNADFMGSIEDVREAKELESWNQNSLWSPLAPTDMIPDVDRFSRLFLEEQAPQFPIFYRRRIEQDMSHSHGSSVQGLKYAMALLNVSTTFGVCTDQRRLEQTFYTESRKYIDATESGMDSSFKSASINTFQALLLLYRYELNNKLCARSFLTLGRASRWAELTGLRMLDHDTRSDRRLSRAPLVSLSISNDPQELEEARRCFWALYIFEAYNLNISDGTMNTLQDIDILVALPCPASLGIDFAPVPMPRLGEASLPIDRSAMSPFAATVLVVSLVRRVSPSLGLGEVNISNGKDDISFWDRYYQAVKLSDETSALLEPFLNIHHQDTAVFNLSLVLKAVQIQLQCAGITERSRKGLAAVHSTQSRQRMKECASWIATAVRFKWSSQQPMFDSTTPSSIFVNWSLQTAVDVFSDQSMQQMIDDKTSLELLQEILRSRT